MKRRSAELKAKIAARDTEIQRWYDLAIEKQNAQYQKEQELKSELEYLQDEIDRHKIYINKIHNRANELGCADILF